MSKKREVQSENELIFFIKNGHWVSDGGIVLVLKNRRAIKCEVMKEYAQGDFDRANRMTSGNESAVETLIRLLLLFGMEGVTNTFILHECDGGSVLSKLSLVQEAS